MHTDEAADKLEGLCAKCGQPVANSEGLGWKFVHDQSVKDAKETKTAGKSPAAPQAKGGPSEASKEATKSTGEATKEGKKG